MSKRFFGGGNSEELQKKRKCQNEPTLIFKRKKVFLIKNRKKEKTQRNISPFQKDQKVETNGKTFFFKKKVCKNVFFFF